MCFPRTVAFGTLGREDVRCEYRFFGLKDGGKPWFAISGIVLALRPAGPEGIRKALRDNIERKLRVQPGPFVECGVRL